MGIPLDAGWVFHTDTTDRDEAEKYWSTYFSQQRVYLISHHWEFHTRADKLSEFPSAALSRSPRLESVVIKGLSCKTNHSFSPALMGPQMERVMCALQGERESDGTVHQVGRR